MYKKVLYNIKKIKHMWGEGQYLNPKHSQCITIFEPKTLSIKKKKKKKKIFFFTEQGLEPIMTSWLDKPALIN